MSPHLRGGRGQGSLHADPGAGCSLRRDETAVPGSPMADLATELTRLARLTAASLTARSGSGARTTRSNACRLTGTRRGMVGGELKGLGNQA